MQSIILFMMYRINVGIFSNRQVLPYLNNKVSFYYADDLHSHSFAKKRRLAIQDNITN